MMIKRKMVPFFKTKTGQQLSSTASKSETKRKNTKLKLVLGISMLLALLNTRILNIVSQVESKHIIQNHNVELTFEPDQPKLNCKVLLFVTTHMPPWHIWNLKSCWPAAMRHSLLLRSADVLVHLSYDQEADIRDNEMKLKYQKNLLNQTFRDQKLTIHTTTNEGYQEGAMKALSDASSHGWFEDYDWVIRLNPDVILRNETYLINIMENDPNATGIFVNCIHSNERPMVHTDFFAIKPSVLPKDAFLKPATNHAERSFTHAIQRQILDKKGQRWIQDARPERNICRSGYLKSFVESPVIHLHPLDFQIDLTNFTCPIPFS
jgi:hypothetical protein